MGLYITAKMDVSLRQWTRICQDLNLPRPTVVENGYGAHAEISEEVYNEYRSFCEGLVVRLHRSDAVTVDEHYFMVYWGIIVAEQMDAKSVQFPIMFL